MRLVDMDNFVENLKLYLNKSFLGETSSQSSITIGELASLIKDEPTAYDIDKVVKELETDSSVKLHGSRNSDNYLIPVNRAIEIVKQGGVADNRKDCELRHDNGNCLKVGGFCTAVDDKHCEKMKQEGVNDVCEWKKHRIIDDVQMYETSCLREIEERYAEKYKYCPYCSKRIKEVK